MFSCIYKIEDWQVYVDNNYYFLPINYICKKTFNFKLVKHVMIKIIIIIFWKPSFKTDLMVKLGHGSKSQPYYYFLVEKEIKTTLFWPLKKNKSNSFSTRVVPLIDRISGITSVFDRAKLVQSSLWVFFLKKFGLFQELSCLGLEATRKADTSFICRVIKLLLISILIVN